MKTWLRRLIVCWAMCACALTAKPAAAGIIVAGTEQAHLDFANDPMFQSVGWLAGFNSGGGVVAGSGVLIAPQWILTAGHVVDRSPPFTDIKFSLSTSIYDQPSNFVIADHWYFHPGYDGGTTNDVDMALVHLSQPIFDVVPAEIFVGQLEVGTHGYISGYGQLGYTPPSNILPFDGMKRGGENIIDHVGTSTIPDHYGLLDWGPAHHTDTLPLEMGASPGDSGGGVFAVIDGRTQLVGIMDFALGDFTNTGAIRPAVYLDWINQTIGVPEPSALVLLALALPCVNVRVRNELGDRS